MSSKKIDIQLLKNLQQTFIKLDIFEEFKDSAIFYDEPIFHYYAGKFQYQIPKIMTNGFMGESKSSYCGGFSFFDKDESILKVFMEAAERLSIMYFSKKKIVFSTFRQLTDRNESALDPAIYSNDENIRDTIFGWIQGKSYTDNKAVYVPAQLVYISFRSLFHEPALTVAVSTGAAAGTDKTTTIERAIAECVERDCTMTTYYSRSPVSRIDISGYRNSSSISNLITLMKQFHYNTSFYHIVNDLEIPCIAAYVIDKHNCGFLTVGSHVGYSHESMMIASLSEALMNRPWLRSLRQKTFSQKQSETYRHLGAFSESVAKRLQLWEGEQAKKYLKRLSRASNRISLSIPASIPLQVIKKGYTIYFIDVTLPQFAELGLHVYKVVVPGLQPLFLRTKDQILLHKRLDATANYLQNKNYKIETIPHPFP